MGGDSGCRVFAEEQNTYASEREGSSKFRVICRRRKCWYEELQDLFGLFTLMAIINPRNDRMRRADGY